MVTRQNCMSKHCIVLTYVFTMAMTMTVKDTITLMKIIDLKKI